MDGIQEMSVAEILVLVDSHRPCKNNITGLCIYIYINININIDININKKNKKRKREKKEEKRDRKECYLFITCSPLCNTVTNIT